MDERPNLLPGDARLWRVAFGVLVLSAIWLLGRVGDFHCIPVGGIGRVELAGSRTRLDHVLDSLAAAGRHRDSLAARSQRHDSVTTPTCNREEVVRELQDSMPRDYVAIVAYVLALVLGCILAAGVFRDAGQRARAANGSIIIQRLASVLMVTAFVIALGAVAAGAFDWMEDRALTKALAAIGDVDSELRTARLSAYLKFGLGALAAVVAFVGALFWRPPRKADPGGEGTAPEPRGSPTLGDFLAKEWAAIRKRREYLKPGPPWAPSTDSTHPPGLFGLALSGGGIRSATFALGVLQGLRERRVIERVDYLSTVSGGGFAGGWWSAWLSRVPFDFDPSIDPLDSRTFPRREQLEPSRYPRRDVGKADSVAQRSEAGGDPIPEGSLSVIEGDPIHHLRLFANYLTPRTGLLSGDTWRAVTVISRNLILTLLALVPVLFAAVMLAQLYFAASRTQGYAFVCSRPDKVRVDSVVSRARGSIAQGLITADVVRPRNVAKKVDASRLVIDACRLSQDSVPPTERQVVAPSNRQRLTIKTHPEVLKERARAMAAPLGALFAIAVALTLLWLLSTESGIRLTLIGLISLLAAGGLLIRAFIVAHDGSAADAGTAGSFWAGLWADPVARLWFKGALLAIVAASVYTWYGRRSLPPIPADRMRNRLVHYHAIVSVSLAIGAAILLAGGFGHEVAWWFSDPDRGVIARAGGWGAIIASLGSAAFTAMKAAPSPKDETALQRPRLGSRVVFALAPILVLVVLVVLLAWLGNWLLGFGGTTKFTQAIAGVVLLGVALEILLAIGELWERLGSSGNADRQKRLAWLLVLGALIAAVVAVVMLTTLHRHWAVGSIAVTVGLLLFRAITTREQVRGEGVTPLRTRGAPEPRVPEAPRERNRRRWQLAAAAGVGLMLAAAIFIVARTLLRGNPEHTQASAAVVAAMAAILLVAIVVGLELALGVGNSDRAIGLGAVAVVSCGAMVLLHFGAPGQFVPPQIAFARAGYGLVASAVALVIALGWAIDPNLVSLHTFYRARLVRAYLGASNPRRVTHEITETAPGDDIKLSALKNHERGGPYHLINTTLNLVGGRDLTTAQRSAENFVLSSLHCGSGRTGYRDTDKYMTDSMTLGMAVAISGAAVSPNMGSATPSAALAMLMALLNVRIGFWAPTPDRRRFYERQPRLWPVYLLRESLSQTNDLGNYCYLTDGGHFDNTALYALIERGCSTVVVVDDGADPQACFGDMGQVIRRCRIDFGTEIRLDVDAFRPFKDPKDEKDERPHLVLGSIEYSDAHLHQLGYVSEPDRKAAKIGKIYWVKPVVRSLDTVDVRQYRLQNSSFPQQTTADQWYDEAQFESYRQLGMLTGLALGKELEPSP
jgi:hypothetical protein